MLLDKVLGEPLKELCVPLDNGFLFLTPYFLDIIILLLESLEDIVKLFLLREDLDHSSQEPSIYILYKSLTVSIDYLA